MIKIIKYKCGHETNGLMFEYRSVNSLSEQMQRFVDKPEWAEKLGLIGYAFSDDGNIPNIDAHIKELEMIYKKLL